MNVQGDRGLAKINLGVWLRTKHCACWGGGEEWVWRRDFSRQMSSCQRVNQLRALLQGPYSTQTALLPL